MRPSWAGGREWVTGGSWYSPPQPSMGNHAASTGPEGTPILVVATWEVHPRRSLRETHSCRISAAPSCCLVHTRPEIPVRDTISGTESAPEPPPWLAPEPSNLQQDPRSPTTRGTCPSPLQPQGPEPRTQGHRPLRGPRDTYLSAGILGRGPPRDTLHPYPPAIPAGPPPSREGSG